MKLLRGFCLGVALVFNLVSFVYIVRACFEYHLIMTLVAVFFTPYVIVVIVVSYKFVLLIKCRDILEYEEWTILDLVFLMYCTPQLALIIDAVVRSINGKGIFPWW